MTHIRASKLTIIGSDNGLSPGRRQAIIWTDAGILLIGHLGINFSEIWIEIYTFSFKENAFENVVWKMAAILSRPQCVNCIAATMDTRNREIVRDSAKHNLWTEKCRRITQVYDIIQ